MEAFGFENKEIKSTSFEKFTGEKGKTYVVAFARVDPSKFFLGSKQHYSNSAQKGWQCLSTDKSKEVCCTHDYDGNEAKWRLGTVLVVYVTNADNEITGIQAVLPWVFSPVRFEELKKVYNKYGHVDMELQCTDSKFQNFTIMPWPDCKWTKDERMTAFVEANAEKLYTTLPKMLSKKISAAEIREILGIGGAVADDPVGLDLTDISSSLGE